MVVAEAGRGVVLKVWERLAREMEAVALVTSKVRATGVASR